uniref:Phosphatidylinositol-specific phospholipase C X domain-containing protein n=1 Tax=Monopterus albus TaxID=43700 RepID=A0A3Q3Q054_MONAL
MSAEKGKGIEVINYCNWMSQLPPELHNIPLFNLTIPGSHDSMSYDLDISSSIVEPDHLKRFSKIYCARKIVQKWAATQVKTITKQLDAGVRYFDLRIARKPNDTNPTRLYFYHGLYTESINEWAKRHPKEILILALSHFKGFDIKIEEQLHSHLTSFIKTLFGTRIIHKHPFPTLKSCWDQGRNIIVSYDYPAKQQPELWSKISYFYGNSMEPAKVESELCRVLEKARPSQRLFVCGLNLTLPENTRILKYILRLCDNFANVIQRSLPKLLRWVKQQAALTPMNIVASDLVTRDNFVSTVVQLNKISVK